MDPIVPVWRHPARATDCLQTIITLGLVKGDGQAILPKLSRTTSVRTAHQDESIVRTHRSVVPVGRPGNQRRHWAGFIMMADQQFAHGYDAGVGHDAGEQILSDLPR
jgi:hypothetical protein